MSYLMVIKGSGNGLVAEKLRDASRNLRGTAVGYIRVRAFQFVVGRDRQRFFYLPSGSFGRHFSIVWLGAQRWFEADV